MIKVIFLAPLIVLGLEPQSCSQHAQLVISDFCLLMKHHRPSRKDTVETLRYVAANNQKVQELCGGGNAPQSK